MALLIIIETGGGIMNLKNNKSSKKVSENIGEKCFSTIMRRILFSRYDENHLSFSPSL